MITFLARRLIPNYDQYASPAVRTAYGMLAGVLGIILNLVLCLSKLIAGMLTGSIAVTADAVNNLSDAGSSVITLIGFRMSSKKPDPHHPFGHGRIEYLSGLAVSMVIILMGIELLKSSVGKILSPEPVVFSSVSAVILAASVVVKLYMSLYNRTLGKRLSSPAMEATSADSRSDALSTAVVLISMLLSHWAGISADGWAGLLVSLAILWSGFCAARDTINPLLGQSPDPELVDRIRTLVLETPEVIGIHDMIVHDYGPGRRMASLHAEVSETGSLITLHDAIDRLERRISEETGCETVVHMDPIATGNPRLEALRVRIAELIRDRIDPALRLHDFRMAAGPTHTNVIFDVVSPFGFRLSDSRLKQEVEQMVHAEDETLFAVVNVEHGYIS